MTYEALGYLKKNSPPATLTASMESTDNSATVDHLEYFHNSTGGLITKGIVIGPGDATKIKPEEITITAASTTSGPGDLTGITRGVHADGTIGVASSWDSGTEIAVNYTYGRDKQIADNFVEHATLITARATKTTAAMSVYVDSAATGTGDGTSWTDAFTTIQAAINSLPVVLEHAATIYVRKGASAYAENISVQQIVGKGSLTLRGEYYWNGQCAAAGTPSTTKFNITSTDGAQIEAGDIVLVTDGGGGAGAYKYYTYSTVIAAVDKGGNVWEIQVNDALDSGNIGTNNYYTIIKTKISGNTTITATGGTTLMGLHFGAAVNTDCITVTEMSSIYINSCSVMTSGTGIGLGVTNGSSVINIRSSYFGVGRFALFASTNCSINVNYLANSASYASVFVTTATPYYGIYITYNSFLVCYYAIVNAQSGSGLVVATSCSALFSKSTICSGTTTGLVATGVSMISTKTLNNNATTPKDPASSSETSHIE
jgi:hypothetical protein